MHHVECMDAAPSPTIEFDCALGESGGQVLRTALAVSALTGKAIALKNIRLSRPNPGLQKQHLTSVQTLASLLHAETKHALPNSRELFFKPHNFSPADLAVNIGTAGSIALLFQTLVFPALKTKKPFVLKVFGGTDVPFAPSVTYLKDVFLPVLQSSGFKIEASLKKHGFYPQGQGMASFKFHIPKLPLKPVHLTGKRLLVSIALYSSSSGLPHEVIRVQAKAARDYLEAHAIETDFLEVEGYSESKDTTGSSLEIIAGFDSLPKMGANALALKGMAAEKIGLLAAKSFVKEFQTGKAVDSHLADQLIPLMALAKGKSTIEVSFLSQHTLTNIAVCEKLLGVSFKVEGTLKESATISVEGIGFTQ